MAYIGLIASLIGTGIKLLGSSGGPNYPSPPKIRGINIKKATQIMENNEEKRMKASIDAWKKRFPLLYQGGQYMVNDIAKNQAGQLSDVVTGALQTSGLTTPTAKNQYEMSEQLGLSPITLSQRTSQAVTRQIAMNPEWTSKISGGTLATMIANNAKNQNAFSQFLGAVNTSNYVNAQTQSAYNTAALTQGLVGAANIGARIYQNNQNPLSTSYWQQGAYPTTPYTNPNYGYGGSYGYNSPNTQQEAPMYSPFGPYGSTYLYGNEAPYAATAPLSPYIWGGGYGYSATPPGSYAMSGGGY